MKWKYINRLNDKLNNKEISHITFRINSIIQKYMLKVITVKLNV